MIKRSPVRLRTKTTTKKVIKRRKKGELTKLKATLWKLCREITIKKYGRNCFTCTHRDLLGGNCQLGHFITSSTCSVALRYDLSNLRIQCYHCNINLSGNWIAYESALLGESVDINELKLRNTATKGKVYPISWFQEKIVEYTTLLETLT